MATTADLLSQVTKLWTKQVALCRKDKEQKFGRTAKRLWDFYGKRYRQIEFLVDGDSDNDFPHMPAQRYRPVLNKSRQFVELYLPFVHAAMPHRMVRPRRPELPPELAALGLARPDVDTKEKIQSWLLEWWLNYLPLEYDAFTENRVALQEALVKGRGVLWHEVIAGPYGDMPGSFHVSVDDVLIDADARKLRDAGYIVRKRWEPCYRVAEDYKIDVDKLRGRGRSRLEEARQEIAHEDAGDERQRKGDLCLLYEIYSRIGVGHRLISASTDSDLYEFGSDLDELGPHVHLVICPDIEHPLNLKPEEVDAYPPGPERQEFLRAQLAWPILFFEEYSSPWPMTVIDPYPNPDDVWATSPLEAGLPIQEYLDKAYNWVMARVRKTCRDLLIYSSSLEKQIEDGLEAGLDQEMLKYNGRPGAELKDLLEIVSFPDIKGDVWKVISMLSEEFEKATGMTPLLYGMRDSSAMRSAQEASIRDAHTTSRPQDIAKAFEDAASKCAAKEAQATRLIVSAETVAPLFSEPTPQSLEGTDVPDYESWVPGPLTQLWMELVQTDDPAQAAAEMHYTIEAGSGMRKNKQWMQEAATTIIPLAMPLAQQEYALGDPRKWNAIMEMVGDGWQIPMAGMVQPEGEVNVLAAQQQAMQEQAMQEQAMQQQLPPEGDPNALPPAA